MPKYRVLRVAQCIAEFGFVAVFGPPVKPVGGKSDQPAGFAMRAHRVQKGKLTYA
jgi:hypothetical protein